MLSYRAPLILPLSPILSLLNRTFPIIACDIQGVNAVRETSKILRKDV